MPIPSNVFNDAVRGFWNQRIAQRQAQELLGKIDQGNRRDVTGGKQMDGFTLAITNLLIGAGVSQESIHIKKSLTVLYCLDFFALPKHMISWLSYILH